MPMNKKNVINILIFGMSGIAIALTVFLAVYVLGANSRYIKIQLDLGNKYLEGHNFDEAIAAFSNILQVDDCHVPSYIGIADAYVGIGDTELARIDSNQPSEDYTVVYTNVLDNYNSALNILSVGYEKTQAIEIDNKNKEVEEKYSAVERELEKVSATIDEESVEAETVEEEIEMQLVTRLKSRKITTPYETTEEVYIYDDKNQLIELGDFRYEYDDNGQCIKEYQISDEYGTLLEDGIPRYISYDYDDNGNIIKEEKFEYFYNSWLPVNKRASLVHDYSKEYEYDERGNVTKEMKYYYFMDYETGDEEARLDNHYEYEYDDQNRLVSCNWFGDSEDEIAWQSIHVYDEDGKFIEIISRDPCGNYKDDVDKNKHDDKGNIILEWDDFQEITTEYSYDDAGNVIRTLKGEYISCEGDESWYYEHTYEYQDSKLVKVTYGKIFTLPAGREKEMIYTCEYTYEDVEIPIKYVRDTLFESKLASKENVN